MLNWSFMAHTFLVALTGIPTTLKLTAVVLILSVPLALLMALSRINEVPVVRRAVVLYVSFVRGTPLVIQILMVYSTLPSLLAALLRSVGSSYNIFQTSPIVFAYIVFTLNTTAILTEVFRSALLTVNRGQLEAARSIGMSDLQAMRRIILPQAAVVALPNMCNTTITLVKSTSLAFIMTVKDITALARLEASYGYNYIEAFLVILLIYILLCSLIELLFKVLERRMKQYRTAPAL